MVQHKAPNPLDALSSLPGHLECDSRTMLNLDAQSLVPNTITYSYVSGDVAMAELENPYIENKIPIHTHVAPGSPNSESEEGDAIRNNTGGKRPEGEEDD